MDLIFEALAPIISLFVRLIIILVATPIILLWPRKNKATGYWQAVATRYSRVFG